MPERSELWHHFEKDGSTGKAICNLCQDKLAYQSTTANLKSHLRRKHPYAFSKLASTPRAPRGHFRSAPEVDPLHLPEVKFILPGPIRAAKTAAARRRLIKNKRKKPPDFPIIKVDSAEQKKLINADLLDLCIDSFLPLSIVEERAFRKFCRWIPGYELPTCKTLTKTIMHNAYIKCMDEVQTQLREEVQSICLTTDMWTSLATETYVALTGHYITQNLEAKHVLLGCCRILEHHTAENIASEIGSLADKYDLRQKVNFIVTNNSDNIIQAAKEILNWNHFKCYAYSLNLMVEHALRSVQSDINKVKKIVSDVNKSTIYSENLQQYQIKQGLQPKQLIEAVDTRWNSTFFMLQRFVELKDAIHSTFTFGDGSFLGPQDWILFNQVCKILHPFEELSISLSEEKYITGSSVIVMTQCLRETCQKLLAIPGLLSKARDMVLLLKSELEYQFKLVETSGTFAIATFLDPRFKMKGFTDASLAEQTKEMVQSLVTDVIAEKDRAAVSNSLDAEENQKTSKKYDPWSIFDEIASTSSNSGTPLSKATKEVDMYLADELLPRRDKGGNLTCPLEWWKNHQYVFPNLKQIFITRCNIVASSVPCENMFSETGFILNDRRTRLTTSKVEQIMFLKVNSPAQRFDL